MPSINKCFVFLALSLTTATALSHGHIAHQGVARSVVEDLTKKDTFVPAVQRRGSNSKRCKARPSHSSSTSSSSSSHHHQPTPKADAKAAEPQSSSSSSSHSHHHHASSQKPDPTTSSDSPKKSSSDSNGNGNGDGGSGGGGGQSYNGGSATFYTQNGNEGACGKANSDDAHICALFTSVYDGGKHCGDQILVTNLKNGKTLPVTVADECPSCDGPGYVDFSQGAFQALGGTTEEGMFPIKYTFL